MDLILSLNINITFQEGIWLNVSHSAIYLVSEIENMFK